MLRILFCLSLIASTMTLVKEYPPFRLYLFDLAFVPLCLVTAFVRNPPGVINRWHRVDSLFVVLLVAATFSFLFSFDMETSVVGWIDWIRIVAFYFVTRRLFVSVISNVLWERLLIGLGVALIAIGMIQLATGSSIGLVNNYFGASLEQSSSATVRGHGTRIRISGTTTNPIIYGLWLNLYCVFGMVYMLSRRKHFWFSVLAIATPIALLGTLTRGAVIAYAASLMALVFLTFQRSGKVVLGALALLALMSPLYVFLSESIDLESQIEMLVARFQLENNDRWELNKIGIELLKDPKIALVGTGSGNFVDVTRKKMGLRNLLKPRNYKTRSGIHNVWLKMFVENGIFVFACFVLIIFESVKLALYLLRTQWDARRYMWSIFWSAKIAVYVVVEANLYESAMSYQFLLPFVALLGYLLTKESVFRPGGQQPGRYPVQAPSQRPLAVG